MINAKKLFEIMIKYHPTIVGWMVHNDMLKQTSTTSKQRNYDVNEIYNDSVKRIRVYNEDKFVRFSLIDGDDYRLIKNLELVTKENIEVYDINNNIDRYCHISQLEELMRMHSDKILDLEIKGEHPRIKGEAINDYIRILERQIQFIKDGEYSFYYRNHLFHSFYYTIWGDEIGKEEKNETL